MNSLHKDILFKVALNLRGFLGENEQKRSIKLILFRIINCIALSLVSISIFANFLYVDGEMYVKTLQCLISCIHVSIKYIDVLVVSYINFSLL